MAYSSKAQNGTSKLPVLSALCLFLSAVEYMIPKPLPFIRLGLANAPLLLALRLPLSSFLPLVLVKIFGQALISGTLFSYVFLLSFFGTAVSALVMYLLRRVIPEKYISLLGINIAGALFSSLTQITLARLFILGQGAIYIAPPFLAVSVVSGTALGIFCERFAEKSRWYRGETTEEQVFTTSATSMDMPVPAPPPPPPPQKTPSRSDNGGGNKTLRSKKSLPDRIPPAILFFSGIFMSVLMLLSPTLSFRLTLFFIFLIAAMLAGKAGNILFMFVFFFVIVFFNALIPYGRVIFKIGAFTLTEGALEQGIDKAAALEGLVMLSRLTISPRLRLPGKAGALLGEAFLLLPRLYDKKTTIHAKTFISDIDKVLLELDSSNHK
ncbi:MAG: Gx transporter family protein [Spirochaetaceae bacterium]|jgi:heptaprenyl diphosphate synthase|nr:Gx transporter family protein [Spirochaetaceae bacterium]